MNKHHNTGKRRPGKPPANRRTNVFVEKARALQAAGVPAMRLLSKAEVLAITGMSFPTIWAWMRDKKFPRARMAGGKSVWRSDEIDQWLASLQVRPLKGDGDKPSEAGAA